MEDRNRPQSSQIYLSWCKCIQQLLCSNWTWHCSPHLVLVYITQRLFLFLRDDSQDASNRLAHNLAAAGKDPNQLLNGREDGRYSGSAIVLEAIKC